MEKCGQIHNSATYTPHPQTKYVAGPPIQQVTLDTETFWKIARMFSAWIHNFVLHDS